MSKRKDLSLVDKFDIIKILTETEATREEVSKQYDVCEATIYNIWKDREEIKEEMKNHHSLSKKRFREGVVNRYFVIHRFKHVLG